MTRGQSETHLPHGILVVFLEGLVYKRPQRYCMEVFELSRPDVHQMEATALVLVTPA